MAATQFQNPLARLSKSEIEYATKAFAAAAAAPASLTFYEVSLHEPFTTEEKAAAMTSGGSSLPRRRAKIMAAEPSRQRVLEGHAPVDSTSSAAVFMRELFNTQPPLTADEYALCERLVPNLAGYTPTDACSGPAPAYEAAPAHATHAVGVRRSIVSPVGRTGHL